MPISSYDATNRDRSLFGPSAKRPPQRRGAIAILTVILLVPLIGMLAFCVDCGYLLKKRAELQRAADAAALAAVRDLVPNETGYQDLDAVKARLREYAASNMDDVNNFSVLEEDITIGRYDPATVYSNFTILDDGVYDTVQVTLRRDASANSPIPLLFGRVFGFLENDVQASSTAVLQKASILRPGQGILPIVVPEERWDATADLGTWSIYGDGRIRDDSGQLIPGNFGTTDIGFDNNSTADIRDQISTDLRQSDLDALYGDDRILQDTHIDSLEPFWSNGDTGLSAGIKDAIIAAHGEYRLVPLIDGISEGTGGRVEYHISGWGMAKLVTSEWNGNRKTRVEIQKMHRYDGLLRPNRDLSVAENVIVGGYTSPVLVQ